MGKERRRHERVESLISIKYVSKTGEISGYALTRDLSHGGVGLPVDGNIPRGTEIDLTIIIQEDGKRLIPAAAKVVWSRRNFEHWKSRYSAGLEFIDVDPRDKETLLDYVRKHRWIKSDFERALEEDKVPVLGRKGDFLL